MIEDIVLHDIFGNLIDWRWCYVGARNLDVVMFSGIPCDTKSDDGKTRIPRKFYCREEDAFEAAMTDPKWKDLPVCLLKVRWNDIRSDHSDLALTSNFTEGYETADCGYIVPSWISHHIKYLSRSMSDDGSIQRKC